MFLCGLDACIEKLIEKLCFSITHALKHHQSGIPRILGIPFNASNQFLDLMTSISQSLQLLNHAETT